MPVKIGEIAAVSSECTKLTPAISLFLGGNTIFSLLPEKVKQILLQCNVILLSTKKLGKTKDNKTTSTC